MRKLFLLLPALVLSLAVNATVIPINTGTADALRNALNSAADGDIIEMAAGTYVESNSNYIAFTGKNVTVRAVEGADVIVQPQVMVRLKEGATARFEGVKFDCSRLNELGSYSNVFVAADANDANNFAFENCEFYNFTVNSSLIYCSSSNKLASVSINNCYFHNINKSCVFIENTSNAIDISITNSTFANITTDAGSYYAGVIDSRATSGSFLVDHCTFYNVEVINTDYAAIGHKYSTLVGSVVSNCIFEMPTSVDGVRAIRNIEQANNCLTFNYLKDSGKGIHSSVTQNNCIFVDPLFADPANGNFSLAGNWVTMNLSPARGAATDGSDLGDPRWAVAETLPSTDFASPYILLGEKAILSGSFALNGNNYIQSQNSTTPGLAIWKIQAERQGSIQVTLNIAADNTSGHRYEIAIYDAENNLVGTPLAESENAWSAGDKILGSFDIPAVGNYTIKLTNDCNYSSTILEGITLSYLGGAVIPVSPSANTTLNIADALFSDCTRDADYIQFPSSGTSSAWIKWNISTSETAFYDITLNIDAPNAHGLTVEVFENEAEPAVASVSEGSYVSSTGVLALALGRINLVGGKNYIVKVTNAPSGSTAKITSLIFAPVVSSTINLPDVLPFNQAVLSTNAHVTDSKLYFAPIGDTNPEGEWAQWAVATDHDGLFLFTMNVNSDNGQSYRISILDDGENLIDSYEHKPSSGAQTITHYFALPVGNYSVKVENTTAWSRGYLTSLVVTEPSVVTIDETATDNSTWASKVEDSNTYDVQIFRSLRAGMYNTFCLPFAVASDMCKDVFGNDVEIYTLDEAIVDGEVLNVTLKNSDGIYQGTPVFIKPSTDIVNPIFTGVEFKSTTPAATTKTNANFVGTFVSTTLTANTDILYLGPDNTLYYPEVDTPIRGFRAWFTIHDAPSPAPAIRRMNIVRNPGEATSINLINETKNNGKRIENGQLIIIRDGVRYNAMGIMIK